MKNKKSAKKSATRDRSNLVMGLFRADSPLGKVGAVIEKSKTGSVIPFNRLKTASGVKDEAFLKNRIFWLVTKAPRTGYKLIRDDNWAVKIVKMPSRSASVKSSAKTSAKKNTKPAVSSAPATGETAAA